MYLWVLKKYFLRVFHFTIIVGFISMSYITTNQFKQLPFFIPPWNSNNSSETLNLLNSSDSQSKCPGKLLRSRQTVSNVIDRNDVFNYLGFVLRSHSLFYCSVPKVATRTFLIFITYLHIRDDLIPLFSNNSTLNSSDYNQTILSSIKNNPQSTALNSVSSLQLFLSELIVNSSKSDLWSIYQENIFPFIRLRTLTDRSKIFSSKYLRVIFVRHPFERLASAYVDKIASLKNKPLSAYDNVRREICRKYSKFYLTSTQRAFYRVNKGLKKRINEPCRKIVPKFEHFIEYLMSDEIRSDVHWKPYSSLCQFCLFKYNFIGKFETIEEDLRRLIQYLGLKPNDWIKENYFNTGKTKENYKLMFLNLNQKLICFLKYFYQNDFQLFNYHIEDYLTINKTIQCSLPYFKKKLKLSSDAY